MARILYLGNDIQGSTSAHRANALKRLGHSVTTYNPYNSLKKHFNSKLLELIHSRSGFILLQPLIKSWIKSIIKINIELKYDIIWVDSGEFLGYKAIIELKKFNCPIILYNNDDPTGKRDGYRFKTLRNNIRNYDLCVTMRDINVSEFKDKGAKDVMKVYMPYDELEHRPFLKITDIKSEFLSDVAFIGTWMRHEKRDLFLIKLINRGIPISIWGNRWNKSPYWKKLQPYYRGGNLIGREYVAAIQGSKICIGLLSKGNRDMHTTRSMEITYSGGLLCAERTIDHLDLYIEGKEAVFWSDANECATICNILLKNEQLRESIRNAGMKKVRSLDVSNEKVCQKILNKMNIK